MHIKQTVPTTCKKEIPQRRILHKTKEVLGGRGKTILMKELSEDSQSLTTVRKTFIYVAREADIQEESKAPVVHVTKSFDSVTRCERFAFRVKGFFYVNRSRRLVKVGYCHTLKINLRWKAHVSTPKKSVSLA